MLKNLFPTYVQIIINASGFALVMAIVAKCEKIINLAQKILIWRQLLAKKIAGEFFYLVLVLHLWLKVIDSCRSMAANVYLNCQ